MIFPSTPTTEVIVKFLPVTIPPSKRFLPKQTQSFAACSLINLWLEKLFGQDLLRVMVEGCQILLFSRLMSRISAKTSFSPAKS